jgi:recombination protein RecA
MVAAPQLEALLVQLGSSSAGKLRIARVEDVPPSSRALALSWSELDAVLPDGGLPRGVVELAAPRALGGSTSVALAAVRAGQARSASAWCAWLDPEGTLHAPGVEAKGVDLARMLVVRPTRELLGRVAVKVVASGAFEVVVVDFDAVPGAGSGASGTLALKRRLHLKEARKQWGSEVLVRKLALATEPNGTTVLLLTNASKPHAIPWPVALRVELSRPSPLELVVRVAKDKRGRIGLAKTIPFRLMSRASV